MDNTTTVAPMQLNRAEICFKLKKLNRGAFVQPNGKVRYDKLKTLFDQTGLNVLLNIQNGSHGYLFTVQESQIICDTLKL
jgi:hypothetical protein